MDIVSEKENLPVAVIPAGISGKHVVLLPRIGAPAEGREIALRLISERRCLHENRIREHIHVTGKIEFLDL